MVIDARPIVCRQILTAASARRGHGTNPWKPVRTASLGGRVEAGGDFASRRVHERLP